jgi:ADP-glucose pyrophosphorylase
VIIEEGVRIPSDFQIGFNLENDRKHYFVTGAGVVLCESYTENTPGPLSYASHGG